MPAGVVLGLLDTVTFPELITILVLGLVVLGPEKLPGMARQAGEWLAKLRTVSQTLQREVSDVLDDPEMQSLRELGEFAARPRAKIVEYARSVTDDDVPSASKPVADPALDGESNASTGATEPTSTATASDSTPEVT